MKLSKPQTDLLREISMCQRTCADHYPPAKKLVSLGLACWVYKAYGAYLAITLAGRAAINTKGEE